MKHDHYHAPFVNGGKCEEKNYSAQFRNDSPRPFTPQFNFTAKPSMALVKGAGSSPVKKREI